jgi:phosphatidylserine/phosphatidylglycerophosphate/cardiolipin synthase-like enzyme
VAIVSPWLSDVELRLPVNDRFESRVVTLVDIINELEETTVHLIVREGESHNEYIRNQLPESQHLYEVDDLHAKTVVTDTFVYVGSANITRGGLIVNRELCELLENESGSVEAYLASKLDLSVSLET